MEEEKGGRIIGRVGSGLKHATQMNSIRKRFLRNHPEAKETFGYVTSANRLALGLNKNALRFPHAVDAAVIASGGKLPVRHSNTVLGKVCIPEGDIQQTPRNAR